MESDERYMWLALDLARKGWGKTNPNPAVGAVLVRDGEVVGTGFHEAAGKEHAEIVALQNAGEKAQGATLYINLEPCCHYGRTPPCVDALIFAGIRRAVVANIDPNPLVSGKSLKKLESAGISVKTGVLEEKAQRINEAFFKYITSGTPFVALKMAMTLDGKIATRGGKSQWISGEKSRNYVHRLRAMSDGIMVGINTVLQDDPQLTVRLEGEKDRQPTRIIVDSRGRIPLESKVVLSAGQTKTILATSDLAPSDKLDKLNSAGLEVLLLPLRHNKVDLASLIAVLGEREISILLVEGGGTLNYALLEEGLVDKLYLFIAPLLFGGKNALTPIEGEGVEEVENAWSVRDLELKQLENDLLIIGYPMRREDNVYGNNRRTWGSNKEAT